MSQASYAVGNRVYRGGSHAPTRGQVDPLGYVDRELNKPSQARSGLAQAALQQLQQMQGGGGPSMGQPQAQPGLQQMPGMGTGMGAPVGTPPTAQRQITVTPDGRHVFLDVAMNQMQQQQPGMPGQSDLTSLQATAQQLLSGMGQQ